MFKKLFFPVFIISFVIAISGCNKMAERVPKSMETQLALLPEQATAIGYVNVKKIHDSEFFKMILDSADVNPFHQNEYQEFVEATGLDLQKDIDEIYIAGNPGDHPQEKDGLIVVLGKFDSEKIIVYIKNKSEKKAHTLTSSNYEGHNIYRISDKDTINFSFFDANTLLAGSENNIMQWIDKSSGKSKESPNKLISQIDKLKYKDTAWFTINTEHLTEMLKNKDVKKLKSLENLKKISICLNLVETFKLFGQSEFSSGDQAELFYDAIKGFIAAGKLSTSEDRDLVDVLNSIDVNQNNDQVTVNVEFTKQDVEKLLNLKNTMVPKIISAL